MSIECEELALRISKSKEGLQTLALSNLIGGDIALKKVLDRIECFVSLILDTRQETHMYINCPNTDNT